MMFQVLLPLLRDKSARASQFVVCLLAGAQLSMAGCAGDIATPSSRGDQDDRRDDDRGVNDDDDNDAEPVGASSPLTCDTPGIDPGAAPLRRLTNAQYRNTLRDLFAGLAEVPEVELPAENFVAGYNTIARGQASSLPLLEGYEQAARLTAKRVAETALDQLAPCPGGDEPACGATFLRDFGMRVYRRPLDDGELNRLESLFSSTRETSDYATAIRITLQAMLMAPQFVFRFERGEPGDGVVPLTGYEVASRLSYLLWDTMPDEALFVAAADGVLDEPDGIAAEAERMLQSPRARDTVARFHEQWLHLARLDQMEKDPAAFPEFSDTMATAMRASIERFVEHAFWDEGTLDNLLTDQRAFVDAELAPIYDIPGDDLAGMELVDVDQGGTRSGILTQAGIMAALAKKVSDSPVHRGLFVMESFLCESVPAPPEDVPLLAEPTANEPPATSRQRHEQSHSAPACAGCHVKIDGIGFAFGRYDALGRYRTHENDIEIDATGALEDTWDLDGPFTDAVDLATRMADSAQVRQCLATHWFRYGFGREATSDDECALKPIVDGFLASNGDMRTLLISLATSDAFRFRRAGAP